MLVLLPFHTYSFCILNGLFNIHTSCFEESFAVSMLVHENVTLLMLIIITYYLLFMLEEALNQVVKHMFKKH